MTDQTAAGDLKNAGADTAFRVIVVISFCHMLNDMMSSLLPAIYPMLKANMGLSFSQIGLVTLVYQFTASLLQPLIGLSADRRPTPMALPGGTLFSLTGLLLLSTAKAYPALLVGAGLLGMGSSVFHPEASRVVRMAASGRHGLAQSLFQVGGNAGLALGPLSAALVVARFGQSSILFFALIALVAGAILWNVGIWYKHYGLARLKAKSAQPSTRVELPRGRALSGILILLTLIFSKFFYMASITSYYTFYLIHRFQLSVRDAQLYLFVFLASVAMGTIMGGLLGDRFGRKPVIWFSILGVLPFTLLLPYANLFWTVPLTMVIGLILSSAFPAIVVFAQELIPGKVGMISGLFFGFSFGMGGLGAALLGRLADATSIEFVYQICAFLPAMGLLAAFLPTMKPRHQAA